jgi:hypothetical protein
MGGPGSGNRRHWWRPAKKTVVEDCFVLDPVRLARAAAFIPWMTGTFQLWSRKQGTGVVEFMVCPAGTGLFVVLSCHRCAAAGGAGELVDLQVALERTPRPSGGACWWARCPFDVDGQPCNRRVGKLYLPPRARHFGCRACHDLTYRSSQEPNTRDDIFRRSLR